MTIRWMIALGTGLLAGVAAAQDAPALKSEKEKLSYALGMNVGEDVRKISVLVDSDRLIQGLQDGLSGGKTLVTEEDARAILVVLQHELMKKQIALTAENNKKSGEAFLTENKGKKGIVTLKSGLQYKVLKAGHGKKPTAEDTVVCHYRGTLIDGTELESSYEYNQPATFPLKKAIKGWSEALQLMPVGSKWQLFVPSSLAYGERGSKSGIGPNATLIFEVELVSIEGKS